MYIRDGTMGLPPKPFSQTVEEYTCLYPINNASDRWIKVDSGFHIPRPREIVLCKLPSGSERIGLYMRLKLGYLLGVVISEKHQAL